MPELSPEQREIARLKAEIERLRDVERHLRRERDRVRAETMGELTGMQAALREAATNASGRDAELEQRAAEANAREQAVAAREAEVEAATERLREADARLEAERERLAAFRARLERESERLAEWERNARAAVPAVAPDARPATFDEGLRRLAERGAVRSSSW